MYRRFFKRGIDLFISFFAIILLFPFLLPIIIINFFVHSGKPFFTQARPGKYERRFYLIKLRSMNDKKNENGELLPDNQRLTPFGLFLRISSIDELPQLINVLVGDMSIIGPRPLLFKYLPLYNEQQRRRHEVRPGITGLAQVKGRNSITWNEKFKMDIYYIDNLSFKLDIKILWLTLIKVVKREGVNQSATRPMMPFNGNN